MKFTKLLAAAAVAASFIAAPAASAATMGMADLAITGLLIVNGAGAPVRTGITIQTENRTGTAASNFNGTDGVGVGSGNIFSTTIGATVDVKNRCAGASCAGLAALNYGGNQENNTTTHIAAPNGNFAMGDMFIAGSALGVTGANGLTRADSSVTGPNNAGSANATIANSVTAITTFSVAQTVQAGFQLSYNAYIAAFVDAAAGVTGASLGTISWALSLQEVIGNVSTTILNWTPSEINNGLTSSEASQNDFYSASGNAFSNLVTLTGGRTYKLTINQASNSLASEIVDVPEPGSMLLVALGLFALGAASRRRTK